MGAHRMHGTLITVQKRSKFCNTFLLELYWKISLQPGSAPTTSSFRDGMTEFHVTRPVVLNLYDEALPRSKTLLLKCPET